MGGRHHACPDVVGFSYLAIVLDVWSGRVVGWAIAGQLRNELVLEALRSARGAAFDG